MSDDLGVLTLPTGETRTKVEDGTYTPIVTGDITKVDIGKPPRRPPTTVNITLDAEGAKAFVTPRRSLRPRRARSSSS
ncbi:MAG: hypothetical protein ACLTMP_08295 [Eggerthella lenta]